MDVNNFSYAPSLGVENCTIYLYENDDMTAYVEKQRVYGTHRFWVSAYSYDGQMDVVEVYDNENTAKRLYDYIVENFAGTPPTEDLQYFIDSLAKGD